MPDDRCGLLCLDLPGAEDVRRHLNAAVIADVAAHGTALADPTRVTILNRLAAADEVCVCDFVATLDLAQPTVSHHLRVLRDAGLVESSRRGPAVPPSPASIVSLG